MSAVGETLAVGAVIIFGIEPVTHSALAIFREVRKVRASRSETGGGGGPILPPPLAPASHAIEQAGDAWTCRCGVPLAQTRDTARVAMKDHRAALNGAAA